MRNILVILSCALAGSAFAAENDLEKRVEALEYASYQNILQFGGFFENRYDAYTITPETGDKVKMNLNRYQASLDFKTAAIDNIQFFGRLTASGLYNSGLAGEAEQDSSGLNQGRGYGSTRMYLERAFINYTPVSGLAFSFGRLPTVDGPPVNIYDNLSRQGSYPKQAYSSILDGYGITYTPLKTDAQKLSLRYVYSPLSTVTPAIDAGNGSFFNTVPEASSTIDGATGSRNTTFTGKQKSDHVDIDAIMLDYSITGTAVAREITAIVHRLHLSPYQIFEELGFEYFHYSYYLEFSDIASLGLSAYVNMNTSKIEGKGGIPVMITGVPTPVAYVGIMSNKKDASTTGKNMLIGLNYQIPLSVLKNPRIGFESIKGDKGFMQFDYTPKDPFNFYTIRGSGTHIYYNQPIAQSFSARVGMISGKPEYTWEFVGPLTETKTKYSSMYANLRYDF